MPRAFPIFASVFTLSLISVLTARIVPAAAYTEVPQTPWSTVPNGTVLFKTGNPWYAPTGIHLEKGSSMTVEAGVVLKFGPGHIQKSQFLVYGNLAVNGTEAEPVIFTSWHDDSDGTDVDGPILNATIPPQPYDWLRMQLGFSGITPPPDCKTELHYLTIRYAQSGIDLTQYNPTDCAFITDHLTFEYNGTGISSSLPLDLRYSTFKGNGQAIYHWFSPQPIDARWSDWGSYTGPTHTTNPQGQGQTIGGTTPVLYNPWKGKEFLPLTQHEPVIVIPGILGSAEVPLKGLMLDPILHTYDNLVASLIDHYGYDAVFGFPYNWRQDNTITAGLLKQKITEVKAQTGFQKVDIVAHSMGGLVARQYIQSNDYANDVDQLIMLGTPNKGATRPYLIWEAFAGFEDIKDKILKQYLETEAGLLGYTSPLGYVRERIPSIGQLLPTYDYLIENDTNIVRIYPNNYPINAFLDNLNYFTNISRLYERTQASTITSNSTPTRTIIKVVDPETAKWFHGRAVNFEAGEGDKTVPIASALIPSADIPFFGVTYPPVATINIDSTHGDLPSDGVSQVVKLLTGRDYTPSTSRRAVSRILTLFLHSPANILITDVQGRRAGFDPITGELLTEIPGSYATDPDWTPEFVSIPDPESLEYEITLIGTGTGGQVELEAILLDDSVSPDPLNPADPPIATTTLIIAPNEIINLKLKTDELNTENPIQIVPADDDPPAIVFDNPFPDTVYEHHQIINLTARLTDETPPMIATSILDGAVLNTNFQLPNPSGTINHAIELPLLPLGTHQWSIDATDSLNNTTTTSTTFSVIATPASFLKTLDYGVAHNWFPKIRSDKSLRKLLQKINESISKRPITVKLINASLTVLEALHKARLVTQEGYDILKKDLIYIKNYLP